MMRRALALLPILGIFLFSFVARGQVSTGTPPFGSFSGGPFDTINNGDLNVHFQIPILQKNGRGLPFYYILAYDSSVWNLAGSAGSGSWTPVSNWGWSTITDGVTGYVRYSVAGPYECVTGTYPNLQYWYWSVYFDFAYIDSFGSFHSFGTSSASAVSTASSTPCGNGPPASGTFVATDGSGYTLNVTAGGTGPYGPMYSRSGTTFNVPYFTGAASQAATSKYDSNGNEISSNGSSFTDTLGTTALTVSGSGTPSSPLVFSYTAPSGGTAQYKVKYTSYTVKTNFGCSGDTEYSASGISLVSEIDLPDSTKYTFTYEPTPGYSGDVTGRIHSVTVPTGGTITYDYVGGSNGIECGQYVSGSTAGLERYTPDSGSSYWSYSRTQGSGSAWTTTITDPSSQANQTIIQFQADTTYSGYYETERQVYQGSSTVLETVYTCYNGSTAPCNSTAVSLPITQRAVTVQWPDNLESKTVTSYNNYGLVTEKDEYAYGSGGPGSLIRKTLTSYASLGNDIFDRPSSLTVEDGSSNIVAQTNYGYDQSSVVSTSGTPQHASVSGHRGNVTTIQYLVSGSTYLTKTFTNFDTGNVDTATDVNGAQYSYTYGDCGNSLLTQITEPVGGMTQQETWNCTGGVQLTTTDENGKTVTDTYSNAYFWRPDSTQDQMSNTTDLTYSSQTSAESSLVFNNNSSTTDILGTLDGLGRISVAQKRQSPSGSYDSVETEYDPLGRPNFVSLPYSAGSGGTCSSCVGTTTAYDPLGRPTSVTDSGGLSVSYTYTANDAYQSIAAPSGENAKRKQLEYDALGRLTSVCEVTSASGSGSCAQTASQTGYWTKYTYDLLNDLKGVTQNAQSSSTQTRTYTYDDLGRITSELNPETGSGLTVYTYDSDSTCGSSTGDLVKKQDQVGDTICFTYDGLHRLTSVYVASGSYGSATPARRFVYDSATVNGVAMSDAKGRLAEAYTCSGSCSSKITDEGFSYDARGEVTDVYESTPHSSGYYHVTESYFANGAPDVLSNLSGLPTITYNVDGEGRTYSASASSGQNPLSSTTYNNSSEATAVNFGSSDSDTFTYDSNSGRMTQYKFNVNGQSVVGNLTWNGNGSLEQLAITDPFNSANQQTCNYTHDDLARIASANCGSGWSQTFSYDAFGNLQKSGTDSFQPTYNSATNQMTSIGGQTPSYDSNGDVTNDFLNSYSWDANGRPVTVDGVGVTYDALGRIAEADESGTYYETVYSPAGGKLAVMSGQSLNFALVPLAGGAVAEYHGGSVLYYRHADWLGSGRFVSTTSRTKYADEAYGPFGEPYAGSGTSDLMFTGMDQDTTGNVYDFPAREYGIQGRWPSPDPAGIASVDPTDPQTWNRYAYARNSPLEMIDPLGLDGIPVTCSGLPNGEVDANQMISAGCTPTLPPPDVTSVTVYGTPESDPGLENIDYGQSFASSVSFSIPNQATGGGNGSASTGTSTPQSQTPQQKYDSCMASSNNSAVGKVVGFGSLLNLFSQFGQWVELVGSKVSGVAVLKAETSAGVTDYSITAGTAVKATTGLETVVNVGSKALGTAASLGTAAATVADMANRSGCFYGANPGLNPYMNNGLGGPIF